MKVLIIEDEILSLKNLREMLNRDFPEYEVIGEVDSVKETVEFLNLNEPDLIFMDVQLSDGLSFEIFNYTEIKIPIIFTTAFDQYAIKAFQENGIGYLLKPVNEEEFKKAVIKFENLGSNNSQVSSLIKNFLSNSSHNYRKRISVHSKDKIFYLNITEIAYFFSEDNVTFSVKNTGEKYIVDHSLNVLETELNPNDFFRITRNCIASISAIKSVTKHFNSRLKITLIPEYEKSLLVSRIRSIDFKKWLDGKL
ncbi:MAG: LytR/AlgR family response regulator transcription factor [Rhodothermaceae bacterium]